MWKSVYQSVRGTSHERTGSVCQDAGSAQVLRWDETDALLIVCSDGAGSARFAEVGSQQVCQTIVDVASCMEDGVEVTLELAAEWLGRAREALESVAETLDAPLRDFACTALLALVLPEQALFAQIGDGAIVIRDGDGYAPVFWPQVGEYAGTTHFLTMDAWSDCVALEVRHHGVDELAVFTDGLERLALQFADRTAHSPFFRPLFSALRGCEDPAQLAGPLGDFLSSPAVNDRTDDDKTLILATRMPADHAADPV